MQTPERPLSAAAFDVVDIDSVPGNPEDYSGDCVASAAEDPPPSLEVVTRERDLYRRLLELGSQDEIKPFLEEALRFVCEIADAQEGYLELRAPDDEEPTPRWWAAHGVDGDQIAEIRGVISQGIVAAAVQSGTTIATSSALLDPRFNSRASVRARGIAAVLCAPIGSEPPCGVLYLQRRTQPRPFREGDRALIETVARNLARQADRLLAREALRAAADATRSIRERLRLDGVVGKSETLAAVLGEVAMVAPLDVSVLLTGDSGTGKSQLAWVIHNNSPRARRPLVEINCATIPESLIESELFGALPGAHSTARTRMEGKVAAAEGGTLFLDEVGELPLGVQAKLLQLLQSRIYYPLGSPRPLRADVRIIAATNSDLSEAVQQRRFREDLFYRLRVMPLRMPTLAERREDIPELARHFATKVASRHALPHLPLSVNATKALVAAEWPGNVRQLENAIEAGLIRAASRGSTQLEVAHLFPHPRRGEPTANEEGLTFQEATRRFQAALLRTTLEASDGNVIEAARRLDLARSHVYNLIRVFGLGKKR